MTSPGTARRLWALGEPLHALIYFAEEARAAGEAAGLAGFWQTYFAFRAAPLGPVGPAVVTAAFYNFAPGFVGKRVPAVWSAISPDAALEVRLTGVDAAARRLLGEWLGSGELAGAAEVGGVGGGGGGGPRPAAGRGEHRGDSAGRTAPGAVAGAHHPARAPRRRAQRRIAPARGRRDRRPRARRRCRSQHPGVAVPGPGLGRRRLGGRHRAARLAAVARRRRTDGRGAGDGRRDRGRHRPARSRPVEGAG